MMTSSETPYPPAEVPAIRHTRYRHVSEVDSPPSSTRMEKAYSPYVARR